MHAIILDDFGGPEQMRWAEVATPEPATGEVRIRTRAVGLNRADLLQRQGLYPPPAGASPLLGLECSGTIDALGAGVKGWQVGDEVVALLAGGGYAEYVVVPAGQVTTPPPGMDLVGAAGIVEVATTVLSNMDVVHLSAGERFLVHGGAGGIGTFAVQYAKALGCTVMATASANKLDKVRELGADHVFDYREDWLEAVLAASDQRGVDVILDIIGAKYLDMNVSALGLDGRLVIIGMQKGTKGELNIAKLLNRRGLITATSLRNRSTEDKSRIVDAVTQRVWPMIASGAIKPIPETRMPLTEAAQAHKLLAAGQVIGKVVLTVD